MRTRWPTLASLVHGTGAAIQVRSGLTILLLVSSSLTVGCGGEPQEGNAVEGTSSPPQLVRIDACNLLSPEEVGDVLGTPVAAPSVREVQDVDEESGTPSTLATICVYDGGWPQSVNLTVRQNARAGAKETSAQLAESLNRDLQDLDADTATAGMVEGGPWAPAEVDGHAAAVRDAGEGGWTAAARQDGLDRVEVMVNAPSRNVALRIASMVLERLH